MPQQRFLVTTPGLSATRWISFALATHPEVFVAHGKHPLTSVVDGSIQRETKMDDLESLTLGNALRAFYASSSLDEVFRAYSEAMPRAQAIGNVHTFTVHELQQRLAEGESLDGIRLLNVTRHPVTYADSHTSLIRSSEKHAELFAHYQTLFEQALENLPEMKLIECPDPRVGFAFAASCESVRRFAGDFCVPEIEHFAMERLTTDATVLREFCERVTGLDYAACALESLIQAGPINRHRKAAASRTASDVYWSWQTWQRDLFRISLPDVVRTHSERMGYDMSMLDAPEPMVEARDIPLGTIHPERKCLGDYVADLVPPRPEVVHLCEEAFCGYNIVEVGKTFYAILPEILDFDTSRHNVDQMRAWLADGICVRSTSLERVRAMIAQQQPELLEEGAFGVFNVVRFRGRVYALAQSAGGVDLRIATLAAMRPLRERGLCFVGLSVDDVQRQIEGQAPVLIEPDVGHFNIICYRGEYWGLSSRLGAVTASTVDDETLARWEQTGLLVRAGTADEVRQRIAMLSARWGGRPGRGPAPRLIAGDFFGHNIVEQDEQTIAISQQAGPVELDTLSANDARQLANQGWLVASADRDVVFNTLRDRALVATQECTASLTSHVNRLATMEGIPAELATVRTHVGSLTSTTQELQIRVATCESIIQTTQRVAEQAAVHFGETQRQSEAQTERLRAELAALRETHERTLERLDSLQQLIAANAERSAREVAEVGSRATALEHRVANMEPIVSEQAHRLASSEGRLQNIERSLNETRQQLSGVLQSRWYRGIQTIAASARRIRGLPRRLINGVARLFM